MKGRPCDSQKQGSPARGDCGVDPIVPAAQEHYIDLGRAARILGVHPSTIYRLTTRRRPGGGYVIGLAEYRPHARKRVLYSSILRLCDELRARHGILDRRPDLGDPLMLHRDEDLLPFPLADTMPLGDACRVLGYEKGDAVLKLITMGFFEGYQLVENAPWRVSRKSLAAFLASIRDRAPCAGVPYRGERPVSGLLE